MSLNYGRYKLKLAKTAKFNVNDVQNVHIKMERGSQKNSGGFEIKDLRHIQIIAPLPLGGQMRPHLDPLVSILFNTFLIHLERFPMQMIK